MATDDPIDAHLKFYGLDDHGTFMQADREYEVLSRYDPMREAYTVSEILELYNAWLFVKNDLFPQSLSDLQRAELRLIGPRLRKTVANFFKVLDSTNVNNLVIDVNYVYHEDLLTLLQQHKVYDRCSSIDMLSLLRRNHISLSMMLTNQSLVRTYNSELTRELLGNTRNAELLIREHLEQDALQQRTYLPLGLTNKDARSLIDGYLDRDDANPNFVELVALARVEKGEGLIDARLKLKAERKHRAWREQFFQKYSGVETGCSVSIVADQTEPVEIVWDGAVCNLSYSRAWFEDNLDYPTLLNNFLYLFDFADQQMLLRLPAYHAELSVVERFMTTRGRDSYLTGAAFKLDEQISFLQTTIYNDFLKTKDIDLESLIAWFFSDYIRDQFGAGNFRFVPASRASTYLEKCRHLFAEMESVARQYSLFVEHGEIDRGLLSISSEQVRYRDLPSLMSEKYVYQGSSHEISNIMYLLFSDQSGLTYINEDLRADDLVQLLVRHVVHYEDFLRHQKAKVDYLIGQGIVKDTGDRIQIGSADQLLVLRQLFKLEAVSYYHCSRSTRGTIEQMISKGWLKRHRSLLTESEVKYFNYYLNRVDFSNGPDLRNAYLHGSQADADDEEAHFSTYVTALKLLIALVIKMNDDLCLREDED